MPAVKITRQNRSKYNRTLFCRSNFLVSFFIHFMLQIELKRKNKCRIIVVTLSFCKFCFCGIYQPYTTMNKEQAKSFSEYESASTKLKISSIN